jgi:hypothetical protein
MAKKKAAKRPPKQAGICMTANKREGKKQLMREHSVRLTTMEAIALCDAANYAANRGFDDGGNWLRAAFNSLMDQCGIDCEYTDSGRMNLILPPAKPKGAK